MNLSSRSMVSSCPRSLKRAHGSLYLDQSKTPSSTTGASNAAASSFTNCRFGAFHSPFDAKSGSALLQSRIKAERNHPSYPCGGARSLPSLGFLQAIVTTGG